MAYYVELSGGKIAPAVKLSGGGLVPGARLSGGSIYATGSGGGGPVNLQSKSVSYTPTESAQTDQVTADQGYDGLSEVDVSVGAISSTYVGSAVPRKTSSDLSASGATVTAPSGYYENSASMTVTDPNLTAGNIKKDVTIFGVTGTYEGDGMSDDVKDALLTLASKVAYIDDEGQQAYMDLLTALYPVQSISAVYTQTSDVLATTPINDLKNDLVVTGTLEDSSTITLPAAAYTLSGTLSVGTSVITVTCEGKTTTFNVLVKANGYLYCFEDTLASSGTLDFGLDGPGNYTTGVTGKAYYHEVTTPGTASTDRGTIYKTGISSLFTNDFTLSMWQKSQVNGTGHWFNSLKTLSSVTRVGDFFSASTAYNGWSAALGGLGATSAGARLQWNSAGTGIVLTACSSNRQYSNNVTFTPPAGFVTSAWHHYAFTHTGTKYYLFVDGVKIFEGTSSYSIYDTQEICLGSVLANGTPSQVAYGEMFDDLYYIASCKWTADFDPNTITY